MGIKARWITAPVAALAMGIAAGQTSIDLRTQSKSVDFSQAPATKPSKMGTALPPSCQTGETFFKSDATAGKNLYGCTAANVWTLLGVDQTPNAYVANFAASSTWTVAGTVHRLGTCDLAVSLSDTTKTPPEAVEPDRVACDPASKDLTVAWATAQAGKLTMLRSGGGGVSTPGSDTVQGAASVSGTAGRMVVTGTEAGSIGAADQVNWNAADKRLTIGAASGPATLNVQAPAGDLVVASFGREGTTGYETLGEIRSRQTVGGSGNEAGRGSLRLWDNVNQPGRDLELGFYEYGAGMFTENLFEFWTRGVSIRDVDGTSPPFLAVRDSQDANDIRLRHDGTQGLIETTGPVGGGIQITGGGSVTLGTVVAGAVAKVNDAGRFTIRASDDGVNTLQVGGPTSVDGVLHARGGSGGFRFSSRFGYGDWQWYADVGTAYLYDHAYGTNRLTVHSGGLNVAGTVEASGYRAGGLAGISRVIAMRKADDSGTCSITVTQGLITSTTCP